MTYTIQLLLLTCLAACGICMPMSSPFEMNQEPLAIYDVNEISSGEIEEYQPRVEPWDEGQNLALLYQLLRKYSMEAGKNNVYREGNEKIKRNNHSRRGKFCAFKTGCGI